jgi:hypothetical protein
MFWKTWLPRDDTGVDAAGVGGAENAHVFRQRVELAARDRFDVTLVGKELVGDAHLDEVGFAGEHQQGLVLRLPAKSGDGAVIATAIELSGDAQVRFQRRICREIRLEREVGYEFDEPETESGRGDAENDIVFSELRCEVRLRDIAARRIWTPGDRVQFVHLAIRRAIRISHEPRFADRTIQSDERRHDISGALQGRDRHLGIDAWAAAADGGLRVAAGTLIEIV